MTSAIETLPHAATIKARAYTPADIADVQARLRRGARRWSDASWAIDTAVSLERKAANGYRASDILGDASWNLLHYSEAVQDATDAALEFLEAYEPRRSLLDTLCDAWRRFWTAD